MLKYVEDQQCLYLDGDDALKVRGAENRQLAWGNMFPVRMPQFGAQSVACEEAAVIEAVRGKVAEVCSRYAAYGR